MRRRIIIREAELKEAIHNAINEEIETIGQFSSGCDLLEMAAIGKTSGGFQVYVRGRDSGNIPHVHIFNTQMPSAGTLDHFETCVQLNTNAYFLHGPYVDTLNSKERKDFMAFMCAKPLVNGRYKTNYERAIDLWNENNMGKPYVKAVAQYKIVDREERVIVPDYQNM